MDERYEDIVDRCIQQVLAGASPDAVADAYPEHRVELLAVLAPVAALVAAPVEPPASAARTAALHRMLAGLNAASSALPHGFLFRAFSPFSARPVALRLASGGAAVLLFAGASIGASAATGHGPAVVRSLFGGSGSGAGTQVRATVVSSSPDGSIVITTPKGERIDVRLNAQTRFSRNGEEIQAADLKPGDVVQVHGKKGSDQVFEADDVQAEPSHGDDAPSAGATPEPTSTAGSGGEASHPGDDGGSGEAPRTPEPDRSHEGPGSSEPTTTDSEGEPPPRPAEATAVPSGHGSPASTPTSTSHGGDGETSTPHSGDTPEARTPESGD
jgi:hypothetical protein